MSEVDTYIKENAQVHQFAAEVAKNHIRYPTDARVLKRASDSIRREQDDRHSYTICQSRNHLWMAAYRYGVSWE